MKAIAISPGSVRSARVVDIKKPEPKEDEVLVKVLEVGIDGTDIEINSGLYGEAPKNSDFLIIGHESLGVVEEPSGNLKKGDTVVATVRRPCPQNCLNCKNQETDMCLTGDYLERGIKGLHGYMSEYYVEKPTYLIKVPSKLKKIGVLLEPLSIIEKGVSQIYHIQKRMSWEPKNALVLGAGSIGLLATMVLRLKGLNVHTLALSPKDSTQAQITEPDYRKDRIGISRRTRGWIA